MKKHNIPHRRALAALVPAVLLLGAPVFAQEAQTAPPPIVTSPAAPTPAPVQTVTPPPVVPTIRATPPTDTATVPVQADTPVPAPAARRIVRRKPAPAPVSPAPVSRAHSTTPVAARPAQTVAVPPPVAAPAQPIATPPVAANPAPPAAAPVQRDPATTTATPAWPWIAGAVLLLGALALFLLLRRRRMVDDDYYDDAEVDADTEVEAERVAADPEPVVSAEPQFLRPAFVAPAVIAPMAVAPALVPADAQDAQTASEDASIAHADAEDLAGLAAVDAPVADRPWLEFAMRPVRAGTNVDEGLVEIELTIGNTGSVAAEDVRVATFMFASRPGDSTNMERLLIERGDEHSVPPIRIAPGEGTRVDATLALPRSELVAHGADGFSPVVVADARYSLPDGSEGRTSASFRIGLSDDSGRALVPFPIDEKAMREDIEAELYGTPEHA